MRRRLDQFAGELGPTFALALPVVLGHLGLMTMSLVDTAIVGRLGPAAVAAVGVGNAVFAVSFMFGIGLLMGLDRTVAFAHGAGRDAEYRHTLVQGVILATLAAAPLTALILGLSTQLHRLGVEPAVLDDARSYLRAAAWGLWPALVFTAIRQALQGVGDTRAATVIALVANGVNLVGNLLFVTGAWGFPALGVPGSGYATGLARLFMAGWLGWHAWRKVGGVDSWRPDWVVLRTLARLGVPAGLHIVIEGGVFGLVTILAAKLGAVPGAAHQIVLQVASFTFMVPLGVSAAGSVRVGQALGRGDVEAARRAGVSAVVVSVLFMLGSGGVLLGFAAPIVRGFGQPEAVGVVARQLLLCAALFQMFDGAQVTLAGVLRGTGDTMSAMAANLVAHWAVGLPLGALLCYGFDWGVTGLWVGLATGLAVVAGALGLVWRRRIQEASLAPVVARA